jgi:hypothetical protein
MKNNLLFLCMLNLLGTNTNLLAFDIEKVAGRSGPFYCESKDSKVLIEAINESILKAEKFCKNNGQELVEIIRLKHKVYKKYYPFNLNICKGKYAWQIVEPICI